MKDKLPLITIIVLVMVFIGTVVTIIFIKNADFKAKSTELTQSITETQKKIDDIAASKDVNSYTPEELVKAFLVEVKSDATQKAKLYLSPAVQDMDIKNTLKLGSDLSNMVIGDSEQTVESDIASVMINLEVEGTQVARTFEVTRVDGAWKITGISTE